MTSDTRPPFSPDRIQLDHELTGPSGAPVLLLVAGLGMQRVEWPVAFLDAVHAAGMRTLTVDNRDCGRSTVVGDDSPVEPGFDLLRVEPAYTLRDLALDLLELLAEVGLERVHALGISMGGMVAQHLALEAPERLASLTSLMSTTGAPDVGHAAKPTRWIFRTPEPTDLEGFVAYAVRKHQSITAPGYDDSDAVAQVAREAWARGVHPRGTGRQLAAIRSDGDRTSRLAGITTPTLVVHGTADPMIDVSGGQATAQAIPGARIHLVEGMGHTIPIDLAGTLAQVVADHAARHG